MVVHGEAHEPAKQQVVVDLIDQLPLAADGIEGRQRLCPQQSLWRDRASPKISVEDMEFAIQRLEDLIDYPPDGTQRMIL